MRHLLLLTVFVGIAAGQPAVPDTEPLHFDHAKHKARGLAIDGACTTCHATDAKGTIAPPAALGHSPCLNGACHTLPADKQGFTHATWFVATGATGKAKHPDVFAKATRFCLGCHDGTEAPSPASKPTTAAVLHSFLGEREFHVTMKSPATLGHFTHVQSAGGNCTGCHTVGGKSDVTPGHAQCQVCHGAGSQALHAMSDCGKCHVSGGRAETYNEDSRPHTDVRQCGSEGHVQWAKRQHLALDKIACFSHDKPGHQHVETGTEKLECVKCHQLVVDQRLDLPALHRDRVIPTEEQAGHALCAGCHHHATDVRSGSGKACLKCHADHARKEFQ